ARFSGSSSTAGSRSTSSRTAIVGVFGLPVETGMVPNLARPGGNITGVAVDIGSEQWGKRLQLLRQVVPHPNMLAFLGTQALLDYSITLSARASSEECISIPSTFAVLRLMLNSNFVG